MIFRKSRNHPEPVGGSKWLYDREMRGPGNLVEVVCRVIENDIILSLSGITKTEKFWISPGGSIVPLKGSWHYQWALKNTGTHGIDLKGEVDENPVRLLMLSGGWWRMNFERKHCQLTIEGDGSGVNSPVVESIYTFLTGNRGRINTVSLHILDGNSLLRRSSVSLVGISEIEIFQWLGGVLESARN